MEPSTTNSIENQHKNHGDRQLRDDDHQPLIVSCKGTLHDQEINNSSNPSSCVVSEAFFNENADDEKEKRLENEPVGREKLMSHRREVSVGGKIVIPERWGQEDLLKDWIDYSTFDALLAPKQAGLAREALVAEARGGHCVSKLGL